MILVLLSGFIHQNHCLQDAGHRRKFMFLLSTSWPNKFLFFNIIIADYIYIYTFFPSFFNCRYVAPEILKGHPYDQAVDMWSVGVIIYVALCGYPPFLEQDQRVMLDKIRRGEYEFYAEDWNYISRHAQKLIRCLLKVDPDSRYSASTALHHEWIKEVNADELSKTELKNSLDNLTKRSLDTINSEKSSVPFRSYSTLPM